MGRNSVNYIYTKLLTCLTFKRVFCFLMRHPSHGKKFCQLYLHQIVKMPDFQTCVLFSDEASFTWEEILSMISAPNLKHA